SPITSKRFFRNLDDHVVFFSKLAQLTIRDCSTMAIAPVVDTSHVRQQSCCRGDGPLSLPVLSLDPANLTLQGVEAGTSPATIFVQATAAQARCPKCNEPSERIHSHYLRKLADLPWQGQ